jgi:superoxide dismutase
MHTEYLKKLKLQYSVLEKSCPCIAGRDVSEIQRMRVKYKDEILSLKAEISAHELFFASFGAKNQTSSLIKRTYGSEASFIYELYEATRDVGNCFAFVNRTGGGVEFSLGEPKEILKIKNPVLSIDLFEHSYFLDYGFEREEYIKNMLAHLNLNKVT